MELEEKAILDKLKKKISQECEFFNEINFIQEKGQKN